MVDTTTAARSGGRPARSGRIRQVLGPLVEARTWLAAIHLTAGLPVGIVLFTIASAACALAGLAYLADRTAGPDRTLPSQMLEAALFSVFCLTALVAGIALFKGWVDGSGPAWRTLAANSFGIYYVHPLILYPLAYVILDFHVPAVAKFAFLVVVTLLGSLAVSALVLKRAPGLRRMF